MYIFYCYGPEIPKKNNISLAYINIVVIKWTAVPLSSPEFQNIIQNLANKLYNLLKRGYFP